MPIGKFVFAQLMEFLPRHEFDACVRRYGGERRERGFSCRDQWLCLAFGQLTFRESLRDIETCLRALGAKLYHAGFRGRIARSTLADATRGKKKLDYILRTRRKVDKTTGLRCDQTIVLAGPKSSQLYPAELRRIAFYDIEHERRFVFLTNNFDLPALVVAQLYRCRWQIELFFKWIKQHLRIKTFYGNNPNAVKTQVWTAISVYVLVAIVKQELRIDRPLSEILQILSLSLFEKVPLFEALTAKNAPLFNTPSPNQRALFDL